MSTNRTVSRHRRMIEWPLPIGLSRRARDKSVVSSLHCMNDPQPEGHMASYIARRKFLATLLGGAAVVWPLAARAPQQPKMLRVGVFRMQARESPPFANLLKRTAELGYHGGREFNFAFM